MYEFDRDGLTHFPNAVSAIELEQIETALYGLARDVAGIGLHGVNALSAPVSRGGCLGDIAESFIGNGTRPVRAILFDKTETNNWSLGWHQDRTIVVQNRLEVAGYGPWTVKAGLQHVAPPVEILNEMVTLRLHLDAVPAKNSPLMAAIGSHKLGRIAEEDIPAIVENAELATCLAQRGDIWAYSTLILHASGASVKPSNRRVLQVDYSATVLPRELEWLGIT